MAARRRAERWLDYRSGVALLAGAGYDGAGVGACVKSGLEAGLRAQHSLGKLDDSLHRQP